MQRALRQNANLHDTAIERWTRDMRNVNVDPMRRLMLAVLQEAVLTLIDLPARPSLQRRRLIQDAETWVNGTTRVHPFSFLSICEVLQIDPDCLRRAIAEWRQAARRH